MAVKAMNIFITGASGFVDGAAARRLAAEGHRVRAMSRSSSSDQKIRAMGAEPVRCDLDTVTAANLLGGGIVIHCASFVEQGGLGTSMPARNAALRRLALALATWPHIVKPNEIDVVASTVFRHLEQIDDTQKSRFSRQLPSDIRKTDWLDRIHLDLTFFHPVPVADLDVGAHPYSDAASNFSATNSLAKALGKHHEESLHRNARRRMEVDGPEQSIPAIRAA
jgi:NAD(P)-dependent dehydrogenase (short-subunit alcohol dehydrogenase family)